MSVTRDFAIAGLVLAAVTVLVGVTNNAAPSLLGAAALGWLAWRDRTHHRPPAVWVYPDEVES